MCCHDTSDVQCTVWTGCWASQQDNRVVMACAAINGYHSVVSYCWLMNGYTCRGEETPLLYTTERESTSAL